MEFFDTHCHLDDPALPAALPELLAQARGQGVCRWLLPAVDPAHWARVLDVAQAHEGVVVALGVHPHVVDRLEDSVLERALARFPQMLSLPQVVAVGEVGLDHLRQKDPQGRARQRRVFEQQLQIAIDADVPVCVHCVRAQGAMMEVLKANAAWGRIKGIMHAYGGSAQMVPLYVQAGLHLAFGGLTARPNARRSAASCAAVPPGRLLLETDAPYMPIEHGAGASRPVDIVQVAQAVARHRAVSVQEIAALTTANACALFGL